MLRDLDHGVTCEPLRRCVEQRAQGFGGTCLCQRSPAARGDWNANPCERFGYAIDARTRLPNSDCNAMRRNVLFIDQRPDANSDVLDLSRGIGRLEQLKCRVGPW